MQNKIQHIASWFWQDGKIGIGLAIWLFGVFFALGMGIALEAFENVKITTIIKQFAVASIATLGIACLCEFLS